MFEAPPSGEFKEQIGWDYILDPQPDSDPEEFLAHNPAPNELGDLDELRPGTGDRDEVAARRTHRAVRAALVCAKTIQEELA